MTSTKGPTMKKATAAAALAAIGLVAAAYAGSDAIAAAFNPDKVAGPTERGGINVSIQDRGSSRTMFLTTSISAGSTNSAVVLAEEEDIDVTSVSYTSYPSAAGGGRPSNFYVNLGGQSARIPLNLFNSGSETVNTEFSPPLQLRAGDRLTANGTFTENTSVTAIEIVLYGNIPSAAKGTGMMGR